MPIRKVVFPVAGLGTRSLPATKAIPKEMLTVVDKPLIQYAVEEAVEAGAQVLIFIVGRNKTAIADHFDKAYELETELQTAGKLEQLEQVQSVLATDVQCVYIRQPQALGLGHAVACARLVVGDEPFGVILPDDLIYNQGPGCLKQMTEIQQRYGGSVIGAQRVPLDQVSRYGVMDIQQTEAQLGRLLGMVEKPAVTEAPSDLAAVGRYVLSAEIFAEIDRTEPGRGGEIQLTDALGRLLTKHPVYSYEFSGQRYDCGSKLGYLQANIDYGLRHPGLGAALRQYLSELSLASYEPIF